MAMDLAEKIDAYLGIVHYVPIAAVSLLMVGQLINNEIVLEEGLAKAREDLAKFVSENSESSKNVNQQVV